MKRKSYLGLSIVSCFCFLPLGLIAVMHAKNAANAVDELEYEQQLKKARNVAFAAIIFGICAVIANL